MSELREMHVSDDRLQRYADGELDAAASQAVQGHIAACPQCRAGLDSRARASEAYLDYHRAALIAQDPAPPRAWQDLRPAMARIDESRSRARAGQAYRWLAAAAVVLVAVAVWYRMNRAVPVSAAELLRKAGAVHTAPDPARRIRMRTARRDIVRPAVLGTARPEPANRELETLFQSARFSWDEPLSVRSFSQWRDQLPQKDDEVRATASNYEIHTSTRSGPLHEAVLVLNASDLRPVRETLQFVDDRVEISEAEPAPAPADQPAPAPPSPAPAPAVILPAAGPAQELRVVAALHAIGADLGDPVEITRQDGGITVEATGLTAAREQLVRQALEAIPGVTLRINPPETAAVGSTGGAAPHSAPAARSQLEAVLGEEGVNRILDASEAVMARVRALRGLSRRFPQDVEAQLADADRDVLAAIRSGHVAGIVTSLRQLESALAPLLPKLPPGAVPPPAPWQVRAARIFTAAQTVDHLLNRILAGGEDYAARAPELAEALRRLDAEVAAEARQ